MAILNVEIKARCTHPDRIKNILESKQARFLGIDHQIDTYFQATEGRLKLREGNIEHALIHYIRPNQSGPKTSQVNLYHPKPNSSLKTILEKAIGIKVVVDKHRAIYFIDNVKFHIDQVKDLGAFVEIEAIDKKGDLGEEALLKQCNHYLNLFEIPQSDLLENSYSDMMLSKSI